MPLGASISDTGRLVRGEHNFLLRRDAGGTWRLDLGRFDRRLVGRRVSITGTRADFDLVDVETVAEVTP